LGWNLVSDQKAGPIGAGSRSCQTCRGLLVLRPDQKGGYQVEPQTELFALAHASKFVRPGAMRIESVKTSDHSSPINQVAFKNTDGEKVVILSNPSHEAVSFEVRDANCQSLVHQLGPHEGATIIW